MAGQEKPGTPSIVVSTELDSKTHKLQTNDLDPIHETNWELAKSVVLPATLPGRLIQVVSWVSSGAATITLIKLLARLTHERWVAGDDSLFKLYAGALFLVVSCLLIGSFISYYLWKRPELRFFISYRFTLFFIFGFLLVGYYHELMEVIVHLAGGL